MPLFKKTQRKKLFSETNKLIHGFPKTGKSQLASAQKQGDKEPLFIATEDGHNELNVYTVSISNWDGFLRMIKKLQNNLEQVRADHNCIVLDLVNDIDQMCQQWLATSLNVEHVSDLEHGKGWGLLRTHFQNAIRDLLAILPVTFIALSAPKRILLKGEELEMQAPSLGKGAFEFINGKVDHIMYVDPCNSKKEISEICMVPTAAALAGSRCKALVKNFTYQHNDHIATYERIQNAFESRIKTEKPKVEQKAQTPKKSGLLTNPAITKGDTLPTNNSESVSQ